MKANRSKGTIHSFLTWAIDIGERSTSRPGRSNPDRIPGTPWIEG